MEFFDVFLVSYFVKVVNAEHEKFVTQLLSFFVVFWCEDDGYVFSFCFTHQCC